MSGPADFSRLGDLLGEVRGMPTPESVPGAPTAPEGGSGREPPRSSPQDLARLLAVVWPDVVGPEVAVNARPVQLRQGRLVVSASSSPWAQTLQLMSEAIVGRLNERLGPGTVERAVFRHAGWQEHPRRLSGREPATAAGPGVAAPGSAAPLSTEQKEALAAVERLDLAPELREKITRAMKAAFVCGEQDSVR